MIVVILLVLWTTSITWCFPLGRSKTPRCCYKNKVSRWMNRIKKIKEKALDNWKGKSIKPAREQLILIRNFVGQFYMLSFRKSSFISIPMNGVFNSGARGLCVLGIWERKEQSSITLSSRTLELDYDPSLASEKWKIKSLTRTMFLSFLFLINWALH